MSATSDRNMLLGVMAVQMDFISPADLVEAMNTWVSAKSRPLEEILLEHEAVTQHDATLLMPIVERHIERHDGDAHKSLTAVKYSGYIADTLCSVRDKDVEETLKFVSSARGEDSDAPTKIYKKPDTAQNRSHARNQPIGDSTRYDKLRPHAKGGLGEVFLAQDLELGREVALKEIQPHYADEQDSRSRFVLEAEVTGGLEHPGIVPVYGMGQYQDGRPYYAMRFIRGESLKEAVDGYYAKTNLSLSERALGLRRLLGQLIDVCNAIEYAHSRGVIHRDLKPNNIMLGKYGETLVVDWGLAKVKGRDETTQSTEDVTLRPSLNDSNMPTQDGATLGTPGYMSPEQAAGRIDDLTPASDVYSLGATLYYILAGERAFNKEKRLSTLLQKVQEGDLAEPRTIRSTMPPALNSICMKAMAVQPTDRYSSAKELADELNRWLADEPVIAHPESTTQRASRWMRRHRTLVTTSAAALLITTVSLVVGVTAVSAAYQSERTARQQANINQQAALAAQKTAETEREAADTARDDAQEASRRAIAETKAATQVSEFLTSLFQPSKPAHLFGVDYGSPDLNVADMTVRKFFEQRAETIHDQLKDEPIVRARLMDTVGDIHVMLGDLERGEKLLKVAYEIRQQEMPNSQQLARSKSHLGFLKLVQGRDDESEKLVRDALAMRESLLGPEHPETLETRVLLTFVVSDGIRFYDHERAEQMYLENQRTLEEVLRVRRTQVGDHPDVANMQAMLAGHYFYRKQQTKAILALTNALAIYKKSGAKHHPGEAASAFVSGKVASWTGRHDEAEQYLRQGIAKCKELFGSSHPATIYLQRRTAEEIKDDAAAIAMFRENLRVAQQTYGRQPRVANSMFGLANRLRRTGKLEEAKELLKESLQILDEAFDKPHWRVGLAHYRLAMLYGRMDDFDAMKQHITLSLEEYRLAGINGYSELDMKASTSLGIEYARKEKWSKAAESFTGHLATYPDDHWSWFRSAGWFLLGDDEQGYNKHRRAMLQKFGDTRDIYIAERIAKACLMRPLDGDQLKTATRMADFAIKQGGDSKFLSYAQLAKGLTEFRNGHWEEAIRWLKLGQGNKPLPNYSSFLAHIAIAICHHHAGRPDDARQLLDELLPPLDRSRPSPSNADWQFCHILRKEAEQLILKAP